MNENFGKEMNEMPDNIQTLTLQKITDFTYTIKDEIIEENTAKIKVEMKINDVGTVFLKTIQEMFEIALSMAFINSNSDIDALTEQKLIDNLNGEIPKVTKNIEVNLVKKEDKWLVKFDDDLINALTGNMSVLNNAFSDENSSSKSQEESYSDDQIILKESGEEITLATIKLSIIDSEETSSIKSSYGNPHYANDGAKFIILKIDVTNITTSPFVIFDSDFMIVDDQERQYLAYEDTIGNIDNYLDARDLAPSIKEQGYVVFEVPSDSQEYYFLIGKSGTNEIYKIHIQ